MTQTKDGGYCPFCDTVWASPEKCNCPDETDIKELSFDNDYVNIRFVNDTLIIKLDVPFAVASLDRSQAFFLMLYLQEHLKND